MGKKNKKSKNKAKPVKSKDERIIEVNRIKNKLSSLGLTNAFDSVAELYHILDTFIEDGFPNSGKIKLNGCQREAAYILTSKKHIESSLCLKFNSKI